MKPIHNTNSESGFSLIEVVTTLFILGVILALYQAALGSVLLTRSAKNQETALRVANNKIEELRKDGYAALPASGSFSDGQLNNLPDSSANATITDFNADTKQVLITVQWRETATDALHNVSLTTLIGKNGGL